MAKVTIPGPPIVHFLRDADFVPAVYADIDTFSARSDRRLTAPRSGSSPTPAVWLHPDRRVHAALSLRSSSPRRCRNCAAMIRISLIRNLCLVYNEVVADKPKDMTIAVHMCRGNMNAFWGAAGGYKPIAEDRSACRTWTLFLLEYDTPRAGDFAPLRHARQGRENSSRYHLHQRSGS